MQVTMHSNKVLTDAVNNNYFRQLNSSKSKANSAFSEQPRLILNNNAAMRLIYKTII